MIETCSVEETRSVGRHLGRALEAGDVVSLVGDLGAGKTQLAKGIAEGLAVQDPRVVSSPTFVLAAVHAGRVPLLHIDLYRVDHADLEAIGFDDLRPACATVVEWGEKAGAALGDRLEVTLTVTGEDRRRFQPRGIGPRGEGLARTFASWSPAVNLGRDSTFNEGR